MKKSLRKSVSVEGESGTVKVSLNVYERHGTLIDLVMEGSVVEINSTITGKTVLNSPEELIRFLLPLSLPSRERYTLAVTVLNCRASISSGSWVRCNLESEKDIWLLATSNFTNGVDSSMDTQLFVNMNNSGIVEGKKILEVLDLQNCPGGD